MVDPDAVAFFAQNANNSDKVKALQKQPKRFEWESVSCSEHSPGPVTDIEILYRQAPHPVMFDDVTGKFTPMFFDDATSRGASVDRLMHSTEDAIHQRGRARVEAYNAANLDKKSRKYTAVAVLASSSVRECLHEDLPAIGIYDTALSDNIAHADICAISDTKSGQRSAREHLFKIATVQRVAASNEESSTQYSEFDVVDPVIAQPDV